MKDYKLSNEILEALAKFQQIELEDFQMDVKDLEIIFEPGMAGQIMPKLKLPGALQAENQLSHAASTFPATNRNIPKQNRCSKTWRNKKRRRHTWKIITNRRRNFSRFLHF